MEDRLSFIPKQAFNPAPRGRSSGLGFIVAFCALVFFLSLALWSVLFFYKQRLVSNNEQASISLDKRKQSFEVPSVAEIISLSRKISAASRLIKNHKTPSVIFDFLENYTLKDVSFSDFNFSSAAEKGITVSMTGLTKGYSDIALQNEVFKNNTMIKEVVFSDFGPDSKGLVKFSVKLTFVPSFINYYKATTAESSSSESSESSSAVSSESSS